MKKGKSGIVKTILFYFALFIFCVLIAKNSSHVYAIVSYTKTVTTYTGWDSANNRCYGPGLPATTTVTNCTSHTCEPNNLSTTTCQQSVFCTETNQGCGAVGCPADTARICYPGGDCSLGCLCKSSQECACAADPCSSTSCSNNPGACACNPSCATCGGSYCGTATPTPTIPIPTTPPTLQYIIQGIRVLMPGNQQGVDPYRSALLSISPSGGTFNQEDPAVRSRQAYSWSGLSGTVAYTVSIAPPIGASVGYTVCYNDTTCHNNTPTAGSSFTVDVAKINDNYVPCTSPGVPAGCDPYHYVDLWWHFTGSGSNPTSTPPPGCLCNADGNTSCASECVFDKFTDIAYPAGPIKCSLPSTLFPAPPSGTDSWCQRNMRTKGDADGNGVINATDYFYFISANFGAKIPATVNPDFNVDGTVDNVKDREIIVKSLKSL